MDTIVRTLRSNQDIIFAFGRKAVRIRVTARMSDDFWFRTHAAVNIECYLLADYVPHLSTERIVDDTHNPINELLFGTAIVNNSAENLLRAMKWLNGQ